MFEIWLDMEAASTHYFGRGFHTRGMVAQCRPVDGYSQDAGPPRALLATKAHIVNVNVTHLFLFLKKW